MYSKSGTRLKLCSYSLECFNPEPYMCRTQDSYSHRIKMTCVIHKCVYSCNKITYSIFLSFT